MTQPTPRRQFELLRQLGAGSFGTVYLADMVSLGDFRKRVALKVLNPEFQEGSEAGQRLRDEARLLGRLRHRNIVSVDDLVRVDGRWGVVMEYISGVDLDKLVAAARNNEAPIPPVAALEVTAAIADALHAAYNQRIDDTPLQVVHRDIKPSNVLLTGEGEVKVLDFGIARASFIGREAMTGAVRFGSLAYMSPERVLGGDETTAGDVYAVGCVLFELLALRRLGRAELGPDQQAAQVAEALDELGHVDAELRELLGECLRYDPEDRPTASDVAARAAEIARRLDGESLRLLAARMIPAIEDAIEHPRIDGVLSEQLGTNPNPTLVFTDELEGDLLNSSSSGGNSNPTIAAPLPPAPTAPVERSLAWIGGLSLVGAALGVIGLGALVITLNKPPAETPLPPPVEPPPAPTLTIIPTTPEPVPPPVEEPAEEVEEPAEEAAPPPQQVQPVAPPKPVSTPAAEPEPDPPPPEEPAEILRSVKFAAPPGATSIKASCGGVSSRGTGSVNLRQVPAGVCTVSAEIDGQTLRASVPVSHAAGFNCAVDGDRLLCQ